MKSEEGFGSESGAAQENEAMRTLRRQLQSQIRIMHREMKERDELRDIQMRERDEFYLQKSRKLEKNSLIRKRRSLATMNKKSSKRKRQAFDQSCILGLIEDFHLEQMRTGVLEVVDREQEVTSKDLTKTSKKSTKRKPRLRNQGPQP